MTIVSGVAVCAFCGRDSAAEAESAERRDQVPLTWVTSLENGKPRVYCDRCARDHLRSIESKLDSEWW